MPISALIVDDEPLARAGLLELLQRDPDVGPVHLASGGREAVELIRRFEPELVLLDVQMPELDGLSVISEIGADRFPAVVFVTAHDQYALSAFELAAIDYLLKPVTAARFAQAMARAKARLGATSEERAQRARELGNVASHSRLTERLAVRDGERIRFVSLEEIEWFQGAENYVELHLVRDPSETYLVQVTMTALERALDPARFARVHRSLIVQLAHVSELRPIAHGEYQLVMASGACLRSGRTYHERVKALLRNPF